MRTRHWPLSSSQFSTPLRLLGDIVLVVAARRSVRQMAKKRQVWGIGDVFLVRLADGTNAVAQIVEADVLNCASCAFFDLRISNEHEIVNLVSLPTERIFSILFVTKDELDQGTWSVVKKVSIAIPQASLPYEYLRSKGFVGAKIIGSGIIDRFLNAYYGLEAWDDWHDPNYLDKLLISPTKRPRHLLLKKSMQESLPNSGQESECQSNVALWSSAEADSMTDLDRKTLEHLEVRSEIGKSHLVLHYLYFRQEDSANNAADELRSSQFVVEIRIASGEQQWQVLAKHQIVPTAAAIAAVRRQMEQIADENSGEYDGWEAKIEKNAS